jgi:hypothetical protein
MLKGSEKITSEKRAAWQKRDEKRGIKQFTGYPQSRKRAAGNGITITSYNRCNIK